MNQCLVCCLAVFLSVCFSPLNSVGQALDEDVLEVKIKGVTIDPQGNTPVVILEEQQGHRAFPIWIGLPEARAIMFELEGVPTPRPLTHVLLHNILVDLNVKLAVSLSLICRRIPFMRLFSYAKATKRSLLMHDQVMLLP